MKNQDTHKPKKQITSKRMIALLGVILLLALYIFTFFVAIFAPGESDHLFLACFAATITLPVLIWIYTWLYGQITHRHNLSVSDQADSQEPSEK